MTKTFIYTYYFKIIDNEEIIDIECILKIGRQSEDSLRSEMMF